MKILLRSMFIGDPTKENTEWAFRNYLSFNDSALGFEIPTDIALWSFLQTFAQNHNHCPDVATLRSHFGAIQELEVLDRIETLMLEKPIYRGDFMRRLEEKANDRRTLLVLDLLKQSSTILQTGVEIKEGRESRHLRGPIDAINFLTEKSHDIVVPTTGTRLSGEITRDGEDAKRDYERTENDPQAGVGQFTGIEPMDKALKGARKFELWTHAAFTGHGKSTLMMNWAYNQAVYMGYDSCIFSLEMPYKQCRTILFAMHSLHGDFNDIRLKLGIQKSPTVTVGLPYSKIRDGELNAAEKKFYFDYVIPHFGDDKHGKIHIEVADPDKDDFKVPDLRAKAELLYSRSPYNLLFVDHGGLMAPRKKYGNTTENLNEVVRDLKRLSMSFNRGAGMPVVVLFQINRTGFKEALKAGGMYNLTHLSYANEIERSSDVVTTSWISDEMRTQNLVQFQCLKVRDHQPFDPFQCRIEWIQRRLINDITMVMSPDQKKALGDKVDGFDDNIIDQIDG